MADWDYAHCLPYFKRMETCVAGADEAALLPAGQVEFYRHGAARPDARGAGSA